MPNLPAISSLSELASTRVERQTSREITKARQRGDVITARETAKIETVANVTEAALLATAHVSAIESLLITQAPHAEQRLRHLADAGCAGMASIVLGVGRRI